jgi:hypothetical protein
MRFETPTALALEAAFDGGRLTSDGGICWLAKADSELGLCKTIADHAQEWRRREGRHSLVALVRQRIFQIAPRRAVRGTRRPAPGEPRIAAILLSVAVATLRRVCEQACGGRAVAADEGFWFEGPGQATGRRPGGSDPGYAADLSTMHRLITEGPRGQGDAYRFHGLKARYREEYAELAAEAQGQGELLYGRAPASVTGQAARP